MERTQESNAESMAKRAPPHASAEKNGGDSTAPDITPEKPHHLIQAEKWIANPELPRAAGIKGGSVCVPTPHYSKCSTCDFKTSCPERFKEATENRIKGKRLLEANPNSKNAMKLMDFQDEQSRCTFELQDKKGKKTDLMRDYKAFVSFTPENTLEKLHMLFKKLENVVDDDPSYTKLASLFYMMMNIYKMKFGKDAPQVAVQINNNGNPSVDIKAIMDEMRSIQSKDDKQEMDEYVNVFAEPKPEEEEDDASEKNMEQFKFAPDDTEGGRGA